MNAVLRKLAAEGEPDPGSATLAERWSHPADLVDRWISRFGADRTVRLMEWNNGVPAIGACIEETGDGPECGGRYLEDYRVLQRSGSNPLVSLECPAYIQDESAAIVGRSLAAMAVGGEVLEIGAAPGGKTHHLQASASLVISMDSSPARMERWAQNRRRLNWREALPLVGSGTEPPLGRKFGMVLVDAPCTNTGVYRRRPDARWKWSSAYLIQMARLQRDLLDSAAGLVAPSGVLAYSTCSLEDEENFQQVDRFENIHSDYRRIALQVPAELASEGMISIFPSEHGIDGMFAAAWRRET